jgi:hypothetical protein
MFRLGVSVVIVSLSFTACGGGNSGGAESEKGVASESPSGSTGIAPCELLSADQVATVLANSDEGFVAKAGGSLIEGVDSYQCSYSNPDTDLFTVILTVAVDDERFEDIEPNPSTRRDMFPDSFREVDVGDRGWVSGQPDDMKLTAIQGRTVIDLELMASDAGEKTDALIALGVAIASQLE